MAAYDDIYKILVVGEPDVGKTCLTLKYTQAKSRFNFPTIGVDLQFRNIELNGKVIKLQIWLV